MSDLRDARKITATDLQRNFGTISTDLMVDQQIIVVTNHGRPQFAMLPMREFRLAARRVERRKDGEE